MIKNHLKEWRARQAQRGISKATLGTQNTGESFLRHQTGAGQGGPESAGRPSPR
jgi:hypothetical protein